MNTEISDLDRLYRNLDIDVRTLSSKPTMFSSNTPESALSPLPFSEKQSPLEKEKVHAFHVKKDVRFATYDDSSVIAYASHPVVDSSATDVPRKCSGCDNRMCDNCSVPTQWSILTQVYIGSITVVGLYAIFRALQRSK
jgi:hypothetical protein